ncbi:MAG: BBP7 family outer membrane beta-barrel protein [Verrucomicrobia bacterium]|nr:BBP7 family outer membrane beta-barrel protein [Verrucomicrobiota bacterium]
MWKYLLLALLLLRPACAHAKDKYWVDADYLLWFIKDNPNPVPLVTKASFDDPLPGAIGQPHTRTVLGKKSIDMGLMQGFQVDAGLWIRRNIGIEGGYFLLPTVSESKSVNTSGSPGSANYAVPIFDVSGVFGLNGVPGETIFILPGPIDNDPGFLGKFRLQLKSRLQGAELNAIYRMVDNKSFQLKWLGGFCWVQLHEKLNFKGKTHAAAHSSFGNAFYNIADRFETANDFLAGQLKIDACYQTKRWYLEANLKGALGAVLQKVNVEGSSKSSGGNVFFLTKGTENKTLHGGIFAEPGNRGSHHKNPMAWGFESKVQTGFDLTKHVEVHVGYTFLWISKMLRPGKQIDRKINSTRTALADASRATVGIGPGPVPFGGQSEPAPVPQGPHRPKVPFKSSTFWAQGLNAGIEFRF